MGLVLHTCVKPRQETEKKKNVERIFFGFGILKFSPKWLLEKLNTGTDHYKQSIVRSGYVILESVCL